MKDAEKELAYDPSLMGTLVGSPVYRNRAVQMVLLGYAMYETKDYKVGRHMGLTDEEGAMKWLAGEDLEGINHYKVGHSGAFGPARQKKRKRGKKG